MLRPRIAKVVVNVCVGTSGDPLERACRIVEQLTGQRPAKRKAKKTVKGFDIRKGEEIACTVTLRGERALNFLRKALQATGNKLPRHSFDRCGNFAFGIREHIDIPGTKYDPRLGIIGMDICVTLERRGYRVSRRKRTRAKVGRRHRLTQEEAIEFVRSELGVEVVD